MAKSAGTLFIEIEVDQKNFQRQLARVNKSVSSTTSKINNELKRVGALANKALLAIGAAAVASSALMTKSFVSAGASLESLNIKFKVVFDGLNREAENWAKTFAKSSGRGTKAVRDWMASLQDMLVPMGATTQQALEMDKALISTALAVGRFNGATTSQVLDNFKSALAGSTEVVQKYGIDIKQAALQTFAYEQGMTQSVTTMNAFQKSQLIVKKIVKDSSAAIKGSSKATETFVEQVQNLKAAWQNFRDAIGLEIIDLFTEKIKGINTWLETNQKTVKDWETSIVKAFKGAFVGAEKLYKKVGGLDGVLKILKATFISLTVVAITNFIAQLIASIMTIKASIGAMGKQRMAIDAVTSAYERQNAARLAKNFETGAFGFGESMKGFVSPKDRAKMAGRASVSGVMKRKAAIQASSFGTGASAGVMSSKGAAFAGAGAGGITVGGVATGAAGAAAALVALASAAVLLNDDFAELIGNTRIAKKLSAGTGEDKFFDIKRMNKVPTMSLAQPRTLSTKEREEKDKISAEKRFNQRAEKEKKFQAERAKQAEFARRRGILQSIADGRAYLERRTAQRKNARLDVLNKKGVGLQEDQKTVMGFLQSPEGATRTSKLITGQGAISHLQSRGGSLTSNFKDRNRDDMIQVLKNIQKAIEDNNREKDRYS